MARNTRQAGNRAENAFMLLAEALGYCTFAARGSRGPVDVLCFHDHHNFRNNRQGILITLVVQVGTAAKPIAATLAELHAAPRPIGSCCIVARRTKQKNGRLRWRFHSRIGTFDTLEKAIT